MLWVGELVVLLGSFSPGGTRGSGETLHRVLRWFGGGAWGQCITAALTLLTLSVLASVVQGRASASHLSLEILSVLE